MYTTGHRGYQCLDLIQFESMECQVFPGFVMETLWILFVE